VKLLSNHILTIGDISY